MKKNIYICIIACVLMTACDNDLDNVRVNPRIGDISDKNGLISQIPDNTFRIDRGMESQVRALMKKFKSANAGLKKINIKVGEPGRVVLSRRPAVNNFKTIPLFNENYVVLANEYNTVEKISLKQLRQIYLGKITNWKELGWDDRQIIPVCIDRQYAPAEALYTTFLKIEKSPPHLVLTTPDFSTVVQMAHFTPEAIGVFKSDIYHEYDQVKTIKLTDGEISLPVYLHIAPDLTASEKALVKFIQKPEIISFLKKDEQYHSF